MTQSNAAHALRQGEPCTQTIGNCAGCGKTHDLDFYPLREPQPLPAKTLGDWHCDAPVLLGGAICHESKRLIQMLDCDWRLA